MSADSIRSHWYVILMLLSHIYFWTQDQIGARLQGLLFVWMYVMPAVLLFFSWSKVTQVASRILKALLGSSHK